MTGMAKMGISRFAASRGLLALEGAGLVSVVRHAGRKPVVMVARHSTTTPTSPNATSMAEPDKVVVTPDDNEQR
jgi:hypothetical protein